jgi:4-amino-4-deoxy-L-arabinose transferase-like glycosyltransferase
MILKMHQPDSPVFQSPVPDSRPLDRQIGGQKPAWFRVLASLLLLLLFAQLVFSANLKSPTIDEPNHLARGYAYLQTGDLRLSRDEGHPPLYNLICALPLALLPDLSLPVHRPSWQSGFRNAFAIEFLFGGDVPLERVFFLGRLPVMLTTLCLAALVARWASELYGPWGGIFALFFCAFDPNLVAHGRLVTTDVGVAFAFVVSVYLFWRFLRAPSWLLLLLSGLALGLAQGIKFSALLLFPVLGLLGLIEALRLQSLLRVPGRPLVLGRWWLSALLALAGVMAVLLLLAGLTLWAIYGFQVGRPAGWPISMPAPVYVEGLQKTLSHASEAGHPAFLIGDRSTEGWWYYFAVVFALKTPLATLIGLLAALASNAWKRTVRAELALLLVPGLYFLISIRSMLNIGYRHLLPMLPFLWVYVGRLGPLIGSVNWSKNPLRGLPAHRLWARVVSLGLAALVVWLMASTLSVAPHYLAYFNVFAGGPEGGWRYLVDSNLDWGQELWGLDEYLAQENIERVYLSWFGCTYPHLYGRALEYGLLPSHFAYPYPLDAARSPYNPLYPAPGLYVIGATNLNGVGLAAGDVFKPFRSQEPVERIGYSLFVYRVPGASGPDASNPTCISGLRFKDLADETEARSLGRGPGAVKWFDHASSFILPAAGNPVYVLPSLPLGFAPAWQAAFMARAEVVHVQQQGERTSSGRKLPGATVYHLDRASADELRREIMATVSTAPQSWSPSTVFDLNAEVYPLSAPVSFEHGLEWVGYVILSGETLKAGETLDLLTVWRPTAEMPAAASDLRAFVHLIDERSGVWGAEDRLDLHPPTWEASDLLIQHHRVPLAEDAPPGTYQLEIGLYAAITMARQRVYADGAPVADRLLLQPIEVTRP